MKFSPINFQSSLAAAGVALMPFAYLQFFVPHDKGIVKLSDIINQGLLRQPLILLLTSVMILFVLIHFILTALLSGELLKWLINRFEFNNFLSAPQVNIGVFSPLISLAMTINIIFGPLVFFFSLSSNHIQGIILYAFLFWGLLWLLLLVLEGKMLKKWFTQGVDIEKLNFGWLLDAFAFGMVSLAGSGIASLSSNIKIASLSAFMTLFTMVIGFVIFSIKLAILFYGQLKATRLPDKPFLPSYFTVIPVMCLYGISFYKFSVYLKTWFNFNLEVLAFFVVISSFVFSAGYIIFFIYLLTDYFKKDFLKNEFYPSLWTFVCAFVGFDVLGSYVYGNYYRNSGLGILACASIVLAAALYFLFLTRYLLAFSAKER